MSDSNPGLMTIFGEALEQSDPAARAAYLDRACGADTALRQRVETLLAAHAGAGRFLEPGPVTGPEAPTHLPPDATAAFEPQPQPPTEMLTEASQPAPSEDTPLAGPATGAAPGTVIAGRYTLVEIIGEGGMGSVYRAEQTEPVKRPVALKLIKSGMDSRAVLARFDAERQALALMDHPNIARVYDGGTTASGQPFFVMELVQGVPLTDYCDHKQLSVKARLELFVQVCQAVQHAHQKGIIHRDLKPGNVLVTEVDGRPTPKVIDFGVAKATEVRLTDLSYADTGAIVGTPAYMSPEQADPSSMDIDTRTDVYALGVMLYELLVGSPPLDARQFKRGAVLEMLRMVREVDPPRPSTKLSAADDLPNIAANRDIDPAKLAKSLRGELDWVVMKALEKDRTRRYDSANAFAADVQRYLADEVVEARPPSAGYRLRKFVRRHKGQVIAASLVLLALLGGIVGTTLGLFEAKQQAEQKEKARQAEAQRGIERDEANVGLNKANGELNKAISEVKTANDGLNKANDELKHRLGVSSTVLAAAAYDNRDLDLTIERLNDVPAEQRGWEWRFLRKLTDGGAFTLYAHTGPVTSVAYSPDGTRIFTSGGRDDQPAEARVWDARTGTLLLDVKGLPKLPKSQNNEIPWPGVWFGPDGSRIVVGNEDGTVAVWDTATGKPLFDLKGLAKGIASVAFSPDGKQFITGGHDRTLKMWDATTGSELRALKGNTQEIWSVAFSPDSKRFVTVGISEQRGREGNREWSRSVQTMKLWDAESGTVLLERERVEGQYGSIGFSPDGKRIVAGTYQSDSRGKAVVWDAGSGAAVFGLKGQEGRANWMVGVGGEAGVNAVAYSPDGTRIVTATRNYGGEAKVWDARTGAELNELRVYGTWVQSVAFSPDGAHVITGCVDGIVKVWNAGTSVPRLVLKVPVGRVGVTAFTPDLTRVVVGSADHTTVWDTRTGTDLVRLIGHKGPSRVAISSDGTRVVTAGGQAVKVWDARTEAAVCDLKGLRYPVSAVAFGPDGTRLVTGGGDPNDLSRAELRVWDAATGAPLLELEGHGNPVQCVAFSPDGTRIVSATGINPTVIVWDARIGKPLLERGVGETHIGPVLSAAFSPDGKWVVTSSDDRTAKVWDAATGAERVVLKGHTGAVTSAAFSADGQRIITGGMDGTTKVWDVRTGTVLLDLYKQTGQVTAVGFSSDGTRVVTAGSGTRDKTGEVIVWDARRPALDLGGHAGRVVRVAFSPDSTRLLTASEDKTAKVWDTRTGAELVTLKGHTSNVNAGNFSADGSRVVTGSWDRTARGCGTPRPERNFSP